MKIDGWIYAQRNRYPSKGDPDYKYDFFPGSDTKDTKYWQECGYIPVKVHTVEFDLPEGFNPIPAEIAALRAEQAKIRAEAQLKVNQLQERISNLLAIENKS